MVNSLSNSFKKNNLNCNLNDSNKDTAEILSNSGQIYNFNNLFHSNNNINDLPNKNYKNKFISTGKGKFNKNKFDFFHQNINSNKTNFIYNINNKNNKNDILTDTSNFNYIKESNQLGYLKNIRNDEMKLRKLINERKQNRIELIKNHHFETLRNHFKNINNGFYLTSLMKENPNNMLKDNKVEEINNLNSNENILQIQTNYMKNMKIITQNNSYIKENVLEENKSCDNDVIDEKNTENNIIQSEKIYEEDNNIKVLNKLFNNEAIKNLNSNKKTVNFIINQFDNHPDSLEKVKENDDILKRNSLKELGEFENFSFNRPLDKKQIINHTFSYKNEHNQSEDIENIIEEEEDDINIKNKQIIEDITCNNGENENKSSRKIYKKIIKSLKLNEEEILPISFLFKRSNNKNLDKNLAKIIYTKDGSENIENPNDFMSTENLLKKINYDMMIEDENIYVSSKRNIEKNLNLQKEKKKLLNQILNNSDSEIHLIKEKGNIRSLRPCISLFKDTVYSLQNEINYQTILEEDKQGLSQFEKILVKINLLFKKKFEGKDRFTSKVKDTFMIQSMLRIKKEHTNQIDEFYETKLGSLNYSINSIKTAENLFSQNFLIKFFDYIRYVRLTNELEKQNLNKLKQNKSELDIDIIRLNSNIYKMKEKLSIFTEYRNFMICVKEPSIKAPSFFTGKKNTQDELIYQAKSKLSELDGKIKIIQTKVSLIEEAIKFESDKNNKESDINKAKQIRKSETQNTNSINLVSNYSGHKFNTNINNSNKKPLIRSNSILENNLIQNILADNNNIILNGTTISKNDPNFNRLVLEQYLVEENANLDNLIKIKEEYSRYLSYLTVPIFKSFDEFYNELKKLENVNIKLLREMNEKSSILHKNRMELYEIKSDNDRISNKYNRDLILAQTNLAAIKSNNKDLKEKLNTLLISIHNQNHRKINKKKFNNTSSIFNKNKKNNENQDNYKFNNLYRTINGFNSREKNNNFELSINNKTFKKPSWYNNVLNIFNLVNEIKIFEKLDIFKNMSFDEKILVMLKHIENIINTLLHKHENFKKNPLTRNKLNAVTIAIDKENRAKKSSERIKQVLDDHKKMIERVNYKFNRLNVLPIRKCPPRFKPKDTNDNKNNYDSLFYKKNDDEDEDDFLDIV